MRFWLWGTVWLNRGKRKKNSLTLTPDLETMLNVTATFTYKHSVGEEWVGQKEEKIFLEKDFAWRILRP